MTSSQPVLDRFDRLAVWSRGDQRAPHKPLLVLYALGRWQQGKPEVTFKEAEPDLAALLREFGPPRKSDHPEQPFWRLQRDGVWTVKAPANLLLKTGDDIPRVTAMRSADVRAGFSADVLAALGADPALAAVCGFDVRLGSVSIALDAAHIRWHQAGGPDVENNGLALCVLHHKTFDLGAFTLADGVLLVSDQVNGSAGLQEALLGYHGNLPADKQDKCTPSQAIRQWKGKRNWDGGLTLAQGNVAMATKRK